MKWLSVFLRRHGRHFKSNETERHKKNVFRPGCRLEAKAKDTDIHLYRIIAFAPMHERRLKSKEMIEIMTPVVERSI